MKKQLAKLKVQLNILWGKILYQSQLLPHRPRLIWHKLWLRKNEFHPSLSYDISAVEHMDAADKEQYTQDLIKRRNAAHEKDLNA